MSRPLKLPISPSTFFTHFDEFWWNNSYPIYILCILFIKVIKIHFKNLRCHRSCPWCGRPSIISKADECKIRKMLNTKSIYSQREVSPLKLLIRHRVIIELLRLRINAPIKLRNWVSCCTEITENDFQAEKIVCFFYVKVQIATEKTSFESKLIDPKYFK